MRKAFTLFYCFSIVLSLAQVNQTANDFVPPYDGVFRPGMNLGIYSGFSDEELAVLAAGSESLQVDGAGVRALRPSLPEHFLETYGYSARLDAFAFYDSLQLKDHTLIVGYPSEEHRDLTQYCPGYSSELFANLYEPIWDDGANGTPVNENNYFAKYIYETVLNYGEYVKFWEIWNEPGFDYTGSHGWLPPGSPGNWWENNPDPCDYKLRAPIFHYIRILRISYEVIKTLSPEDYVVLSGTGYPSFLDAILRNTDNPADGSMTAGYPLGGGAYFDVMGYHSYPHFDGAMREWSNEIGGWLYYRHSDAAARGIKRSKDIYNEVLNDYGYNGLEYPSKLWTITECNLPRKAFGEFAGSSEIQKNFIIKSFVACVQNDISQFHIYKIAEETGFEEATGSFDLMGIYQKMDQSHGFNQSINEEGIAYKTSTDILFGKTYDEVKTQSLLLPDGVEGAAFKDEFENYTYVIWAETNIDQSESASAIYSFPASFGITQLLKREWNYGATNQSAWVSPQEISLTATPIFLSDIMFNASTFHGCAPLTVQFYAPDFPGAVTYEWIFEAGLPAIATSANAVVNFTTAGTHDVTLTIKNANGEILSTQQEQIVVEVPPTASFEYEIDGPIVSYNNLSSHNADDYEWLFGDGVTSTAPNTEHVFYNSGTYTSTIVATNTCGTAEFSQTFTVASPGPPQVLKTALDTIPLYDGYFRPGVNLQYYPPWTDDQLGDIAAGNLALDIDGVKARSLRTLLPEYFLQGWGYDIRVSTFQHYVNLDLRDNVAILGFPGVDSRDPQFHCPEYQSTLFKDLYTDIWDNGENGTPVNDHNPFALYIWQVVSHYKDYVKYWEIMNAPGYDPEGEHGWLPPGEPGNWWENNPSPCDCGLRAPIFYYIRMLRTSYEIIKSVDNDAYILLSGVGFPSFLDAILRNTDNPSDGSFQTPYPFKGGAYFDALGIAAYPHVDGSTAGYDPEIGSFVYKRHSDAAAAGISHAVDTFTQVLEQYGFDGSIFPEKYGIINEGNVSRKAFGNYFGSILGQRNYEIKAIVAAMKTGQLQFDFTNIAESAYYNEAVSSSQLMGLYQKIEGQTPYAANITDAGISFKTSSKLLYGTEFDASRTNQMQIPDHLAGGAFKHINGDYTYVLWAKTTIDNSEYADGNYSFPASFGYTQLFKREWNFSETGTTGSINSNDVILTGTPIFLSESEQIPEPTIALFVNTSPVIGCPGFTVSFENQSVNATSLNWSFPGGNPSTSTLANPTVTYETPGVYPVHLTAAGLLGDHTFTQLSYVQVSGVPVAGFTYVIDGSWVQFTNQSSGATNYHWDFGQSQTSVGYNPNIYFFENGTYEVQLIAFNACGSDTMVIEVTLQNIPEAAFDFEVNGCGSQNVYFQHDVDGDPALFEWFFEGGEPATSNNLNVLVNYPTTGIFTATLIVSNEFGADTLAQQVIIPGEVETDLNLVLCTGNEIAVNGTIYDAFHPFGTEIISSGTVFGCDSIVHVSLSFLDTIISDLHENLCAGQSFLFKGTLFDVNNPSGVIFDPGMDGEECDTLFYISTTTYSQDSTYISDTIPEGGIYQNDPYQFSMTGLYEMTFTDQNGCDSLVFLDLVVDSIEVATDDIGLAVLQLTAQPNPFDDATILSCYLPELQSVTIKLTDMAGKLILEPANQMIMQQGNHSIRVVTDHLPTGVYLIVLSSEKYRGSLKLIKI